MLARVLDACDAVVADVAARWGQASPPGPRPPDGVERAYAPEVGLSLDDPSTLLRGRRVYVFPAAWGQPAALTRGEVVNEYEVAVLVAERYAGGSGPVPRDWLDERVWFAEALFARLKDHTRRLAGALVSLYRETDTPAAVTKVYDLDLLVHDQRAFWSEFSVTFLESVAPGGP